MLNKTKWKFIRFMYGRYGIDELYKASFVILIIIQLLQIFIQHSLLNILTLIIMIWLFYRVFSKNIIVRQKENQIYLQFKRFLKSKWKLFIRRTKDINSHRYRQCSECKTTLRLPRKIGRNNTRCPKCSHSFEVKIWI